MSTIDLSILQSQPLSENPLAKAALLHALQNKLPSFVGRPVPVADSKQRSAAYHPLYVPDAERGDTVASFFAAWLKRPQQKERTTKRAATSEQQTGDVDNDDENVSDAGRYVQVVADAVETCAKIVKELDDIKKSPTGSPHSILPPHQQTQPAAAAAADVVEGSEHDAMQNRKNKLSSVMADRKIVVSFNGGKDCMVILHLLTSCISIEDLRKYFIFFVHEPGHQNAANGCGNNSSMMKKDDDDNGHDESTSFSSSSDAPMHVDHSDELPEAVNFRRWIMNDVLRVSFRECVGQTLKDHLWKMVGEFCISSVLIGTRHSDPSGKWQAGPLSPTTRGWPFVTLVSPIFSWTYDLIWEYILNLDVPRCVLYDRGFTSLGSKFSTEPNRALLLASTVDNTNSKEEEEGTSRSSAECYLPAWRLHDFSLERANRKKTSSSATGGHQQQQSSI